MKNKIVTLLIIIFVLVTSSILMGFKFSSENVNVQYIKTNWVSGTNRTTIVISSIEELRNYVETNIEKYGLERKTTFYSDTTKGFEDAIEKYDEEYFRNNNLVLVLLEESSGSIRHNLEKFDINNNIIEISIVKKIPDICTCDMAGWHIIIEVNKINITEINVNVE